jgi:hypothetical protein
MAIELLIQKARSSFVQLAEATQFTNKAGVKSGAPRRGITFLIEKDSDTDKAIKKAMLETAVAKWGEKNGPKILAAVMTQKGSTCYASHEMKPTHIPEGMMALTAYRAEKDGRPKVLDVGGRDDPIYDEKTGALLPGKGGRLYSGANVKGKVEFYASTTGGDGVRCGLQTVQRLPGGDAFGGGAAPTADGFDAVEEGADAEDFS